MTYQLKHGDSAQVLKTIQSNSIDLTVTSPPYDNLREYKGFVFDFETIAKELYRVTKDGGVVVWIVADATVKGSETGTSFKQALYFKECGFNLHDTMIWNKGSFIVNSPDAFRYGSVFEYMFIFSKGKPKSFNPIKDRPNKNPGCKHSNKMRNPDGSMKVKSNVESYVSPAFGQRFNVWNISRENSKVYAELGNHPAIFPEKLVKDHILSWSNAGDVVLDPFLGSGTTGKMAVLNGRDFIGIEISPEYLKIAEKRIADASKEKKKAA